MELKDYIRDIPDFPRPGILFRDITPLIKSPDAFRYVIDRLADHYTGWAIDVIVGVESRGFLFAAPLALRLEKSLVPVRKKGKLPFETNSVKYALEYGESTLELHKDAVSHNQRVLIVDDLLATGGTLAACSRLVEISGAQVVGTAVLIELTGQNGRSRLKGYNVLSLVQY